MKKLTFIYIICYLGIVGLFCGVTGSLPTGEWDDYCLPAVSMLREMNFTVDNEDIAYASEMIPEWSNLFEHTLFSPYLAKNGEYMSWYFPTYSVACIPMMKLLQLFSLPVSRAFVYTNSLSLVALLLAVFFNLNTSDKCKLTLIILLSINPIILYLQWASAEVFIYSMIGFCILSWHNKWYKRAAVFASVAGTLNPTIMCIGIIMIGEYLLNIWLKRDRNQSVITLIKSNILDLLKYAACYVFGIIPMIYNYINVNHINLTASLPKYTVSGTESTISRFWAYLFDLNYGILPYYSVLLILGFVLFVFSFFRKEWKYIELFIMFLVNIFLFSIMTHINSGMSGIARYNAWVSVILIFAVDLYWERIFENKFLKKSIGKVILVGCLLTAVVGYGHRPRLDKNGTTYDYLHWTPIASFFLDNMPSIYNPLYSTFYSRTNNVDPITQADCSYDFSEATPIIYESKDGFVRKILASEKDKDSLKRLLISVDDESYWLEQQINTLGPDESYISISKSKKVVKASEYKLGDRLTFIGDGYNAKDYVVHGLSGVEEWGTWTEGKSFAIRLRTVSQNNKINCNISCGVFNQNQRVNIYINDVPVYKTVADGLDISFDFDNPGLNHVIEMRIDLPDAVSPATLGQSADMRVLGLGLREIVFY